MKQAALTRRVVVTGMGMVTPIGVGVEENWRNILDGKSGIVSVQDVKELEGLKSQIGGKLPQHFHLGDHKTSFGDEAKIFSLANAVTKEAIIDAKLDFKGLKPQQRDRVGIMIGNQFGAMENYMRHTKLRLLMTMNHMVSAIIAMEHQITGQLQCTSIASASGGIAIGEAYRLIKHGYQDVMITGGVDFNLGRHFFEGMELFGANCNSFNRDPTKASRPYDQKRAGPVMSDGGGVFVLESLESALDRGAHIYCEIGGFSMNTDSFHILRPTDNGIGLFKAVQRAMVEGEVTPSMVDSVNSHATSTPAGDLSEAYALKKMLGNKQAWSNLQALHDLDPLVALDKALPIETSQLKTAVITAPKGHIGHTFCAAGAIESAFAVLSIKHGIVPQILNLESPLDKDLTFAQGNVTKPVDVVVKTSLAFGGVNSALVYKSYKQGNKL